MISFLLGLFFAGFALATVAIYQTYTQFPLKELKRRSRDGDQVALLLHRTASYGKNAKFVMILIGVLTASLSIVLLDLSLGSVLAQIAIIGLVLSAVLVVYVQGGTSKLATRLAMFASPSIAWIVERTHPVIDTLTRFGAKVVSTIQHTGLYEREDLLELLKAQREQPDNRIDEKDLEIVRNVLEFGDKHVSDVHVPKRVVQSVLSDEIVGPVLMGELHKGGHSRFPVHTPEDSDTVVGLLYLKDMIHEKQGAKVTSVMRTPVQYIHEDATLRQALQAFLKTRQQLCVVVNQFEEYVGILTLEDVLEQILGKPIVDEFDEYEDLRAVAASMAQKEHAKNIKSQQEPTPEATEVVE